MIDRHLHVSRSTQLKKLEIMATKDDDDVPQALIACRDLFKECGLDYDALPSIECHGITSTDHMVCVPMDNHITQPIMKFTGKLENGTWDCGVFIPSNQPVRDSDYERYGFIIHLVETPEGRKFSQTIYKPKKGLQVHTVLTVFVHGDRFIYRFTNMEYYIFESYCARQHGQSHMSHQCDECPTLDRATVSPKFLKQLLTGTYPLVQLVKCPFEQVVKVYKK